MKPTLGPKDRARLTHVAGLAFMLSASGCVPWLRIAVMPGERPSFGVSGTFMSGFRDKVSRLDVSGTRVVEGCPSPTSRSVLRKTGVAGEIPQ